MAVGATRGSAPPPGDADPSLGGRHLRTDVAFAGVVYAGLAGIQTPTDNATPTVVYVLFWVGIPIISALFGDAGHWLIQLVYAAPLVFMAGLLAVSYVRQRRAGQHRRPPKRPPSA